MEHRNLGSSTLRVSAIGLGCNNFGLRLGLEETRAVVHRALDLGITLFDTADRYGDPPGESERLLGQLLGARRKDVVLASKFGNPMDDSGQLQGASRRYIMLAVEASLRRLKTDWLDLYQLHRPDSQTPIEETLRALQDLVRQGKVRHAGSSKFSGAQIAEAHRTAQRCGLAGFASVQDEYSLLARGLEEEVRPAVEAAGLGFIPFYPLAGGLLSGKYRRDAIPEGTRYARARAQERARMTDRNWRILEELNRFCAACGRTMLEVAIGWLLAWPSVASVIAGATRPEQLEENVRAAGGTLTAEELVELDRITGESVPQDKF